MIHVEVGFLHATNCTFEANYALGGTGAVAVLGSLSVVSIGGDAKGGAIHNQAGEIHLVDCLVSGNQALARPGSRYSVLEAFFGGTAYEGDICNNTGELRVDHCTAFTNSGKAGKAKNACGGAIYQNGGSLRIVETLMDSNKEIGGAGFQGGAGTRISGGSAHGGGLAIVTGAVWLTNSTLSGNLAFGGAGDSSGECGVGSGRRSILPRDTAGRNCTIAGNTAGSGVPGHTMATQGSGLGGGLCNNGGSETLDYVTIAGNSVGQITGENPGTGLAQGGGIHSSAVTATLSGTIVANSLSGSNTFGALVDNDYNLSSDSSCNFTGIGSLNNTDPKLGPLDDYGGPTPTLPLLEGSPAIDGGNPTYYPLTDQRDRSRLYGSTSDIGAFESSPPFVIRGQVSGFTLASEVSVSAGVTTNTTTNHRTCGLESLIAWDHAVTPTYADYLFVPDTRLVTVGPDRLGVNLKAYRWNALSLDGISGCSMDVAYAGTNGVVVRLLSSSNLRQWSALSTNAIGSGGLLEFQLPFSPETPRQFYQTVHE